MRKELKESGFLRLLTWRYFAMCLIRLFWLRDQNEMHWHSLPVFQPEEGSRVLVHPHHRRAYLRPTSGNPRRFRAHWLWLWRYPMILLDVFYVFLARVEFLRHTRLMHKCSAIHPLSHTVFLNGTCSLNSSTFGGDKNCNYSTAVERIFLNWNFLHFRRWSKSLLLSRW